MFITTVVAVTLASTTAEPCSQAGNKCCSEAILSCPHLGSGENCQAEHWRGISNGPACNQDYVYTHCVNGKMYDCIASDKCNCEAGSTPQKIGTEQRPTTPRSTNGTMRLNARGEIIRGASKACSAAGNLCCSNAIQNCPNKESVAKCTAEKLQGIDGPHCAMKINYERCTRGARLYCLREKDCDCDAAPLPKAPQQAYDAKSLGKAEASRSMTKFNLVQFVLPSMLGAGAMGLALAAAAIGRASVHRRHAPTEDLDERKSFLDA